MNKCESCVRAIKKMAVGCTADDYTYLEYIQTPVNASGKILSNPYLLLDYYPNAKTEYDIKMSLRLWGSSKVLFGVYDSGGYTFECQTNGSKHSIRLYHTNGTIDFPNNDYNLVMTTNNNTIVNNGTTYTYTKPTATSSYKLALFTCYSSNSGNYTDFISATTFNYLRIYEDGIKLIDLVPAKRKSDNVVGAYDRINKKFYTANNGYFNAGPEL